MAKSLVAGWIGCIIFLPASLGWGSEVPLDRTVEKANLYYDTEYSTGVNERD